MGASESDHGMCAELARHTQHSRGYTAAKSQEAPKETRSLGANAIFASLGWTGSPLVTERHPLARGNKQRG